MSFLKRLRYGIVCAGLLIGLVNVCYAEELQNKVEFTGSATFQSGQLVNYKYGGDGSEYSHQWVQENILTMGMKTQINQRLGGFVGVAASLFYSAFPDSMMNNPGMDMKGAAIAFNMLSAQLVLNLSPNPEDSLLNITIGLFPYKYNREVRNLGEYLFRTGCYPGYIVSDGFDKAGAQLSGIRLSNSFFGSWHNELFLTSELYLYPSMDFSLTYLADYTPFKNKLLNVGGAVQFYRLFPVDNALTQPKIYAQKRGSGSATYAPNWYSDNGDTAYYTFAGTKLMVRLMFDPKPLFGGLNIFGPEDLKFYSEAIILGVKNYPASLDSNQFTNQKPINQFGYNKIMEKMPIMFGLNLPAFKILDVFSVEAEYYGKKYVNRVPVFANSLGMMRLPLPYDPFLNSGQPNGGSIGQSGNYSKDTYYKGAAQWKWSIYAKKTLFNNFNIIAQFSRDHSRIKTPLAMNIDPEEAFIKDKQWYWMLKFGYSF